MKYEDGGVHLKGIPYGTARRSFGSKRSNLFLRREYIIDGLVGINKPVPFASTGYFEEKNNGYKEKGET